MTRPRFALRPCLLLVVLLCCGLAPLVAQTPLPRQAIVRTVNDSLVEVDLPDVNVFARHRVRPLSLEERRELWRRIRDVKKTMPYAKYVAATIIETYEYMQTLPEKQQEAHLKLVEKELRRDMEPKMRDLTLRQGQLLIKLIHRQCGMTGYELVKAFLGGFRAWTWQVFSRVMGASLKAPYDPEHNADDAVTERIVQLYERHLLCPPYYRI